MCRGTEGSKSIPLFDNTFLLFERPQISLFRFKGVSIVYLYPISTPLCLGGYQTYFYASNLSKLRIRDHELLYDNRNSRNCNHDHLEFKLEIKTGI